MSRETDPFNLQQRPFLYTKLMTVLRMYWAKKILEWTSGPQEALAIALYLNDKVRP